MTNFWDRFLSAVSPKKHKLHYYPNLGVQKHLDKAFLDSVPPIQKSLNKALPTSYVNQIRKGAQARLGIREVECQNRWFEWKRFLVLSTQIPSIQMYSPAVDEMWHEMLLSTEEYDKFCQRFFRSFFEHQPHKNAHPVANVADFHREWFELLYLILFKKTMYSPVAWRYFFGRSLPQTVLADFMNEPKKVLCKKYFNPVMQKNMPHATQLTHFIIDYIVRELTIIQTHIASYGNRARRKLHKLNNTKIGHDLVIVRIYLFLSLHEPHKYKKYKKLIGGRKRNAGTGGCGSGSACAGCSGGGSGSGCGGGGCGGGGG